MSLLCGSVWGRVHKGNKSVAWPLEFCPEAVPWHSPWWQTLQFLPICHWCPFSCCPSAGSQREWVCVSPKSVVGPLRGDLWQSHSFFCHPKTHWFLQLEVMGTYLPGTGTLSWVVWCGAGIPHLWGLPPNFYPPHMGMGPQTQCLHIFMSLHLSTCLHISTPPTHLDEYDFFNSLVVGLSYHSIFWWFWMIIVFSFSCNFCFGCVRRWAIFTYASILTRIPPEL